MDNFVLQFDSTYTGKPTTPFRNFFVEMPGLKGADAKRPDLPSV
jgi:hypothetical protein